MSTNDATRFESLRPPRRSALLWFVLAAALVVPVSTRGAPSAAAGSDPATIKVMPLGDSLTDGYNIPGGYRIDLVARLDAEGPDVDLVGSQDNGPDTLTDREHEGHSGFRIDEIAASVDRWLRRYQPDIVLLMIGTNDVDQDHQLDTADERLSALIDQIAEALPTSHVIVASIPRMGGSPHAERIAAYNADVPGIVSSKIDDGKHVSYVDMYRLIELDDLHTDYTHMNAAGNCKLADAWFVAIRAVLEDEPHASSSLPVQEPDCALP